MKKLQIGNVTLDNPIILAPMAGVSDPPAISSALQRNGSSIGVHGDGECQGNLL